ncbi:SlyX family protein [Stieleria sp. TO1_6]|uniref:SlyX family protein n=1 Tax=Stieleria tagensis TaxID=2956795 RepID=UPI00209B92EC|nr:SlyX family protein [Stieleria tagensis]MCO8124863.1 SlyX family protein [Stieleria tagensis]
MKTDAEKICDLEIALAHLQRQYDLLNEVVTAQSIQLDRLQKRITKWEQTVETLKNKGESFDDPLSEKPPHY